MALHTSWPRGWLCVALAGAFIIGAPKVSAQLTTRHHHPGRRSPGRHPHRTSPRFVPALAAAMRERRESDSARSGASNDRLSFRHQPGLHHPLPEVRAEARTHRPGGAGPHTGATGRLNRQLKR